MIDNLDTIFPKILYHSYVIESNPDNETVKRVLNFLELRGIIKNNSIDLFHKIYESFTLEDSHFLKEWHSRLGVGGLSKVCLIATKTINREAEQALLKVIEEPALNTYFFFIIPNTSLLLDTILSRVQVVSLKNKKDVSISKEVENFISFDYKKRFDQIALIIKNNKDEESSGKLRYYANQFINELERIFYNNFKKNIKEKNISNILFEIQKSREYLKIPGSSVKMALENLAIMI